LATGKQVAHQLLRLLFGHALDPDTVQSAGDLLRQAVRQ
jgi:hypothetical protein